MGDLWPDMQDYFAGAPTYQSFANILRACVRSYVFSLPVANSVNQLPDASGVYFLCEKWGNDILYVGSAVSLKRRWQGHQYKDMLKSGNCELYYDTTIKSDITNDRTLPEALFICALSPKLNLTVRANPQLGQYFNGAAEERRQKAR